MIKTISAQQNNRDTATRETVKVYYLNQDILTEPCQIMTRAEARTAKKEGKGQFISNGQKFCLTELMPIIVINQDRQRPATNSCCGLSKREMLANVGVPVGLEISNLEIMKAQEKVKAYPHTYDKLAVLARGSWRSAVTV